MLPYSSTTANSKRETLITHLDYKGHPGGGKAEPLAPPLAKGGGRGGITAVLLFFCAIAVMFALPAEAATTIASGLNPTWRLVSDSTNIYWTELVSSGGTSRTIKRVGINGGAVTNFNIGSNATDIAIDSTSIYWTDSLGGTVNKIGINGGTVTTLASGLSEPIGIAVDSTNVYWTEHTGGSVKKVGINGGSVSTIASGSWPISIAVDSTSAYWIEGGAGYTAVKKVDKNGGAVTTLATSAYYHGYNMAVDSTSVFWMECDSVPNGPCYSGTGTVKMVAQSGGTVTTLVSGLSNLGFVAVDAASVYFTDVGTSANDYNDGAVKIAPIGGGAVMTLESGQNAPQGIAVDSTQVYWTEGGSYTAGVINAGSGTVKKLLKDITPPDVVWAIAGDGQAILTWNSVSEATSYNIYQSTSSIVSKSSYSVKITNALSPFYHTGLTNDDVSYYIITTVNGSRESSESHQVNATPSTAPNNYVKVPGVGEDVPTGVAVPYTVSDACTGCTSKWRGFNIEGSNNTFNPSIVIVNVGDTVHINFTASDNDYDFTIPGYGMKQTAPLGQTKMLEFQAVNGGLFDYYCEMCGGLNSTAKGVIVVATPPSVSFRSPASGATSVPINTQIIADFNRPMDATTVNASTFTLTQGGQTVPGTVTYTDNTATFLPSNDLSSSTTYIATLTTGVKDVAGNAMPVNVSRSFTTGNTADYSAPLTTAFPSGGLYNSSQSISLTCNDDGGSGCRAIYYTTDGTVPTSSSSVYTSPIAVSVDTTIRFYSKDYTGNQEDVRTVIYIFDMTPPAVNVGASQTKNAQFTQTATASDANSMTYSWTKQTGSGTITFGSSTALSTTISASADGTYTIRFTATDAAGNSTYSDMTLIWDTTVPVVSAGSNQSKNASFTQTSTATDANSMTYGWAKQTGPGTITFGSPTALSTTISASADGTYNIRFTATDSAGNSAYSDMTLVWDTSAPTTTTTPAGGYYSSAQTVTLSCSDSAGSGCSNIYYTTDGSTPTTASPIYSNPINISTTTTLKFFAQDNAGNSEPLNVSAYGFEGGLKWLYPTGGATSSPAIGPDGIIYVGAVDSKLYAINADGTLRWTYATGSGTIESSPAIGPDGTIYVGSWDDHKIYAVNPNGTLKWSYTTGFVIGSSPAIGSNGTIYISSGDGKLYAFNVDGSVKWTYATGGAMNSSPAVGRDGMIYVGAIDNKLYAIRPDGTLNWSFATGGHVNSSPAIGSDGTIYVGSLDNKLYAVNSNGTLKWSYLTGGGVFSSPAIAYDGTIYVGGNDGKLYAVNPDGTVKWSYATSALIESSPVIGSDGTVYVGSWDDKLYAINTNGTLKWSYLMGGDGKSSPSLGPDGIVYAGSRTAGLYAIYTGSIGLQTGSSWPMFRNNTIHTGQAPGVDLPRTGQTTCYDASGNAISCVGTGQDGAIQAGIAWPDPRFTVASSGTGTVVTDNLTGLMWQQDGSTPTVGSCTGGTLTWQGALDYVACLSANNYLGHNDWRLPNINELESLDNFEHGNVSSWLSQVFINIESSSSKRYWSSTTYQGNTTMAWYTDVQYGGHVNADGAYKSSLTYYVLPVRDAQMSGAVTIPKTGQAASYYSGDDGELKKGISWPSSRFTDNGNGTTTDNLSGLVWTADANAPGPSGCPTTGTKTWPAALDYIDCLNNSNYLGFDDWRLPNVKELRSLVDYSAYAPALQANNPFSNVSTQPYWTSSTFAPSPNGAWYVDIYQGQIYCWFDKSGAYSVWPVRGGTVAVQPAVQYALTVAKSGTGSGVVSASVGTIIWSGNTGTTTYNSGASVTLTATVDNGSIFSSWSGCDSTSGTQCTVSMTAAKNVTATFDSADTTPPVITNAASSTSNGYYKSGNSINITLNFSEPITSSGLTVNLNSGGSISTGVLSTVSSFSGTYTVAAGQTSSALGITAITGRITDAAGNSTDNPTVASGQDIADAKTIIIDTTAPTLSISGPSTAITNNNDVTYSLTYSGADSVTLAEGNITLNKTGTANGTVSVNGTGTTTRPVTISGITGDGTLGILIASGTASDAAGNTAAASGASVTFIVDNTAPVVSAGSNQTKNAQFTQTATADDANTMTYVWSKVDGPGTIMFGAQTATSTTISASLDGTYVLRFTATDAAGNSSHSDMTLLWDTTAPVVPAAPSDAGMYSASETVTFTWLASSDDESGIAGYNLQVGTTPGGSNVLNASVGNALSRSVTGAHGQTLYARVQAVNGAGSTSAWSANSDGILIDTATPGTPGTPSDGGAYNTTGTVTFNWTAASAGLSGIASYVLQVGTTAGGSDVLNENVGNVLSKSIGTEDGRTLYARVQAINGVGTTGAWSANTDGILVDTSAPETPTAPTDEGLATSSTTVAFTWTASSDPHSAVASYNVQIGTTPGGSSIFNGNVGNLLAKTVTGSHGQTLYARVQAVNNAGLASAWSTNSDGITVDTTGPTAPGAPSHSGAYSGSTNVTFTWAAASDVQSGIASYNLQVGTAAGGNDVYNGNVGNILSYSADSTDGKTLYARVQAINNAGLTGAWSSNSSGVLIDTTGPSTPAPPTDRGEYANSPVTFSWTGSTDSQSNITGYNLQVGTTSGGSDVYNGNVGNVLTYAVSATAGQTLYARVQAVNGAGTAGAWSNSSDGITVDTNAASATEATTTTPGGHYKAGSAINVTITFSEPVTSTGLTINLNSGAAISTGTLSGATGFSGTYTVSAGQNAASLSVTSITGTITDRAGIDTLNPTVPEGANIADSKAIVIDTTAPDAPSVAGESLTNNPTPEWTWTSGDSGNGTYQCSFNPSMSPVIESGAITGYTPSVGLADGIWTLYVQERDEAGNWSNSGSFAVTIDTTAPAAPSFNSALTTASPTNSSTPTWTWDTGGGGSGSYRYKLDDPDMENDAVITPATSFTPSAQGEGSHTLYIQESDAAGNWSEATSLAIEIDLTPPGAPDVNGATPTNNKTPRWDWTSGGGGNGTYLYNLNGSELESAVTTTALSHQPPLPGLGDGPATLFVWERDEAGNWSEPGSFTIVIDTVLPAAPLLAGASPTNNTRPTWTWTQGGEGIGVFRFRLDNSALDDGLATETTGTAFTPETGLAEGGHSLYLQERDLAGNWSSTSSLMITVDLTSPASPVVAGPQITNDVTPTWTWTPGDATGSNVYRYSLDSDDLATASTTTATSYTPESSQAEGEHTLYVQERDAAGNWSASGSYTVYIDITAPNPPELAGTSPTNDKRPIWTWISGGGDGTYRYSLNSDDWASAAETTAETYRPSSDLPDGTHTMYVWERDLAGNWSAAAIFAIVVDTVSPGIPNVSGSSPTKDDTPAWTWTSGGIGGSGTYRYHLDDGNETETTAETFTPAEALSEESHTLYVQERDLAGNWSAAGYFTITVDTTAPNAPAVTGVTPTNITMPAWNWTSGGNGGSGEFRYRLNNSDMSLGTTETTNLSYIQPAPLAEGAHTLYVQERDESGNWSDIGSFTIVIDTTPPPAPTVFGTTPTNQVKPTWTWNSGGGSGAFRYKLNDFDLAAVTGETTLLSYTSEATLPEGAHTLYVQERDGAGNWSSSGSFTITVDATPPSAPTVNGPALTNNNKPAWTWTSGGGGSGTYRYKLDDSNFASGTSQTTSATYTSGSTLSDGTHVLYVQERDAAGNWSAAGSFGIVVDTAAPTTEASVSGGTYNTVRLVSLTCSDSVSGCEDTYYTTNGDMPTTASIRYTGAITINANTTLKFFSRDDAGNAGTVLVEVYVIDLAAPAVYIAAPLDGSTVDYLDEISGTASDTGTGVTKVELQVMYSNRYLTASGAFTTTPTWITASGTTSWSFFMSPGTWGNNTTYTITARATDGAGSVSELAQASFTKVLIIQQAFTTLSLDLSTQTMLQNDKVNVSGKLTRMPDDGTNLHGFTVTLAVTAPDSGATTALSTTTYDSHGHYIFNNVDVFNQKGTYGVRTSFAGSALLAASVSETKSVLVGASAGYAVIVQGKIGNEEGLASHNKTANRIYQKLKDRGFIDDNIQYLNYSTSQAGVDTIPSKGAVQFAIESWARDKMNGSPAPLYLIMVDHGNPNTFYIGTETIAPSDIASWLSTLEGGLNATALAEKRVVIIGACYSGSFISALARENRVIVSSAAADEESYKGPNEPDGVRSGEYFLEEFFKELGHGKSFSQAFAAATDKTEIYTRKGGNSANSNKPNKYLDNAAQHPLLDDNGDGKGSNVLSEDDGDGAVSTDLFLGIGVNFDTNSAENPADILEVTETLHLNAATATALLWAKANDDSQVSSAWFEVRSPSKTLSAAGGSNQLEVSLTKVLMKLNGATGRWEPMKEPGGEEPTYDGFTESGMYEVFYFVSDHETGDISQMKRSVVYKDKAGNSAPTVFDLVSPDDQAEQKTVLLVSWEGSADPDNDAITYTLLVSRDETFGAVDYRLEELQTTSAAIGQEAGLQDLETYYWKVVAVDSYGAKTESSVRSFTTNNTNGLPGIIKGYVIDAVTQIPIPSATVASNTGGSVTSMQNGAYLITIPTGAATLTATATGYHDSSGVTVNVTPGSTLAKNISLASTTVVAVNGACGSSNGQTLTIKPAVNLCSEGSASVVSGTGPWTWSCAGENGGTTASCSVNIQTRTVTPSAEANGSISPNTVQTVNYNGTTSFTITPNTGYHINTVTGCGGSLTGNTYTTGAITADCTVSASFAADILNTFAVTPSAGAGGSISPNTSQTVNVDATTSFTITPDSGHQIELVSGCGGSLSGNTYTTGPITANCTVTASFSAIAALPDGDLDGEGVSITDALRALRIAAGLIDPTSDDLSHGDVAPFINGKPEPDGKIDIGDVVVILRRSVELISW